jgi:hypothetical protein
VVFRLLVPTNLFYLLEHLSYHFALRLAAARALLSCSSCSMFLVLNQYSFQKFKLITNIDKFKCLINTNIFLASHVNSNSLFNIGDVQYIHGIFN